MSNFLFLVASLVIVVKSADYTIRYSSLLAQSLQIAQHVIGFLLIAIISVLPEAFISVTSAIEGVPAFGLGTLFGSNIADLTLVFAVIVFFCPHALKIQRSILMSNYLYMLIMIGPILFGLNGHYSRLEGIGLIVLGAIFYLWILRSKRESAPAAREKFSFKNLFLLLLSMAGLLIGSHMTVTYGVDLAETLNVKPVLIGLLIVGLGTTLPELFFSIKAVKQNHANLALGDILGTVLTDATIIVGIISVINPFSFNPRIVYVTGFFMLAAMFFLFDFMKSDKMLTKREGVYLVLFYIFFVIAELLANNRIGTV